MIVNINCFGVLLKTMNSLLASVSICLFCELLTLYHTNVVVVGYRIKCTFPKNSEIGVVSGIIGIEEFNDFLLRCGDADTEIIRYTDCYIGQISVPVKEKVNNYPSVRIIMWDWGGLCRYSIDQCSQEYHPTIQSCDIGKCF